MRINTNVPALRSMHSANIAEKQMGRLSRRLSSGVKISSAKDDPAGMSISTKLRFQAEGTKMASQNTMNGISVLQTADAGLSEVHSILQRMRELAVQSANDIYTDEDREKIQIEVAQLKEEIDSIANKTDYNRINLLNGHTGLKGSSQDVNVLSLSDNVKEGDYSITLTVGASSSSIDETTSILNNPRVSMVTGDRVTITDANNRQIVVEIPGGIPAGGGTFNIELSVTDRRLVFHTGANKDTNVEVSIGEVTSRSIGIDILKADTLSDSVEAIKALDLAVSRVSEIRSKIAAYQNRLEMIGSNLDTADITIQSTLAKVFDTDMAYDLAELARQKIVNQGALSVLGQANQRPQSVLQLIR